MNPPDLKTEIKEIKVLVIIAEFVRRIDEIFGLYLDATQGFNCNVWRLEHRQKEAQKKGIFLDLRDESKFYFGKGSPTDPKNVLLHTTTLGEYKRRNEKEGSNLRLFGQYFVVLAHHLWDGEYRPRIASVLGYTDPNEIKLPICGDLRLLRNEILKNQSIITHKTTDRLEVLDEISADQLLVLTSDQIEKIVLALKKAADYLAFMHTGVDPKHSAIWHVK